MAEITAARINNLQSRIELILGNGSGINGYGQTLQSVPIAPNSIIDADDINNLYADIIKARIHQVGPSDPSVQTIAQVLENLNVVADETSFTVSDAGIVADDPDGFKKGLADFEELMSQVETDKGNIHPSQASTAIADSSSRTTVWNGLIVHEFIITFNSPDARRHFFNTGGQIRIDPSNVNASQPKGLDWAQLTNEVGVIIFDRDSTSSTISGGSATGNYDLTSSYNTIFTKIGSGSYSGVYAGNTLVIKARNISSTQISFRVEFNDVVGDNAIDNNVDGTLTNTISLYRASGDVAVPVPGVFTNVSLGGVQSGSLPTYILTASTSAVNEGGQFTVTLSTSNVPTGSNVPYTITGVSQADLASGTLTGQFTTDGNGIGVASFALVSDSVTEGVEYFDLSLDNGRSTVRVAINDTSQTPQLPSYQIVPSNASVNEGGTISFTLNTTNVSPGTQVPFTLSGVQREDLSSGLYTWDDWYDEFSTVYWSGFNKASVLARKDIIKPYYEGNDAYNTDFGQLFGLFRRPDAAGLAYWVDVSLQQYGTGESFTNVFFSSVLQSTAVIPWIDSDGRSDAQRSQIFDKPFLRGTSAGVVGDRGTPGGGVSTDLTDSFTVYSNTAVVNYNLVPDYTTEGPETLTITLDNGQATASISVNDTSRTPSPGQEPEAPIPDPVIQSFAWNRQSANYGDPVNVNWTVENSTSVTVAISGLGINTTVTSTSASGSTDTINVPSDSGTLTATITAVNSAGEARTATTTLEVTAPAPVIDYFYSDPTSPVSLNNPVFFAFRVSNATYIELTRDSNDSVWNRYPDITDITEEDSIGAYAFTSEGSKSWTLFAGNDDGEITRTITVTAQSTYQPQAAYWMVEPEWSGLLQSTTVGTTGRGYAQAGGDVDTIAWSASGPSFSNQSGTTGLSSGVGYYTPNLTFTTEGVHVLSMTASGQGGTIIGTDTITVNAVLQPEYELTPSSLSIVDGEVGEFVLTTQNVPNVGQYYLKRLVNGIAVTTLATGWLNQSGTVSFRIEAGTVAPGTYTVGATEADGTILDTATLVITEAEASYTLSPLTPTTTSGQSVTYTLTTTNVSNGTTIYFKFVNSLNQSEIYTLEDTVFSNEASISFDTTGISTGIYSLDVFNTVYDGVVVATGTLRVDPVVPTYSLLPSSMTKVDGESIGVFTLSTTDVSDGTEVYVTIDKASNGASRSVSSPTINNNSVSFNTTLPQGTLTPASDYSVNVRTGSYSGPIVASSSLTITPAPTYDLSPNSAVVYSNSGSGAVFYTVTTTDVAEGTQLYWHVGPNSNANVADASGVVTVGANGTAQFAYTPSSTELDALFTTYLKTGGQAGEIVATAFVTVIIRTDEDGFLP